VGRWGVFLVKGFIMYVYCVMRIGEENSVVMIHATKKGAETSVADLTKGGMKVEVVEFYLHN